MKPWALDYLCCPLTNSPLTLRSEVREGAEIVCGTLVSAEGTEYPIRDGVPRLTVDYVSAAEAETIEAFGNQWNNFQRFDGFYASADIFFTHFPTLQPDAFPGKVVLDAGCGNGRFLGPVARIGPRHVIGLDYSSSVGHAYARSRELPNVSIVQGSILQPPIRKGSLDLIVSMGVIDHLDDPHQGMRQLRPLLTQEGRIAIWIYAHEGNEVYLRLVKPLRIVGPKLPASLLLGLSYLCTVPAWMHTHTLNRWLGVRKDGTQRLPMAKYFQWLSNLGFRDITSIIYDQLSHPLVNYYRREQAESLFHETGLELEIVKAPRDNSWSLAGRRSEGVRRATGAPHHPGIIHVESHEVTAEVSGGGSGSKP